MKQFIKVTLGGAAALLVFCSVVLWQDASQRSVAQVLNPRYYDMGAPVVTDIWVDPVNGNDANNGSARNQALRTLAESWRRIPLRVLPTTAGYRVNLVAGSYPESSLPNYLEGRYGTFQFPIIIRAVDGRGTAVLQGDLNIFDCRYLYLLDFTIRPAPAGDTLHLERCDHVLMRGLELDGGQWISEGQSTPVAHDNLKVNQCQYIYLEDSNVHGADDNAVDFVAVQYGHAVGNRVHNANDWAMYVKGGSAYFRIEANEFYNAGTGGFTTGQGTGFEFMEAPWLHYEAYDIKVINNLVHDTQGAGLGVNGGYNILMAYNTLYRVGQRSHVLEVVYGGRSCDGDTAACRSRQQAGGWGSTSGEGNFIPNRNVYIYNNVVYNPPGYQSQWQHFAIYGPITPPAGTNVSAPARTDTNLQIRGNVIWNGPANHPLGIEGGGEGCAPSNPTCNEGQLRADNAINTVQPQLINPAGGNFRPLASGNLFGIATYAPPNFAGGDRAQPPLAPPGNFDNSVPRDRDNAARTATAPPGAYTGAVATCSYAIAPASQSFSAAGGTGSVTVTTASGCAWTASSNVAWLTITAGASGSGNGAVNYSAAANTSTNARTGTLTIAGQTFNVTQAVNVGALANVSAASYAGTELAHESIVSAFGSNLASSMQSATTLPPPTDLAGTTVRVRDSAGAERLARLFFVAPTQINYQLPPGTAAGTATITVTSSNGAVSTGTTRLAAVVPGLFTADASGHGLPAAVVLRARNGLPQTFEPVARFDAATNRFVAMPIELGPETDQVFLLLFGTGLRFRSSLAGVQVTLGGVSAEVSFAGSQGNFAGLDQLNVRVPRSLAGRGLVDVVLTVDGKAANVVRVQIR